MSFEVSNGTINGLLGPNGAGKSTFMDIITGRTRPDVGSVTMHEKDGRDYNLAKLREFEINRRGIWRKFQTPSIYDDLTVFENLEISYPRGRTVFGALTFQRDATVRDARPLPNELLHQKTRRRALSAF